MTVRYLLYTFGNTYEMKSSTIDMFQSSYYILKHNGKIVVEVRFFIFFIEKEAPEN